MGGPEAPYSWEVGPYSHYIICLTRPSHLLSGGSGDLMALILVIHNTLLFSPILLHPVYRPSHSIH